MNSERSNKKIVLIIISVSRLVIDLDDNFFKQKLFSRLPKLLDAYLNFKKETNVAQYNCPHYIKFNNELENILESIDYMIYSKIYSQTPLLLLKRRVLKLKLATLKELKILGVPVGKTNPERETLAVDKKVEAIPQKQVFMNLVQASSKDRIIDFIRKSKKIRTKDLIGEFSSFSERTVKRTLKELTDVGILKREEANRAVYYSITTN